MGAGFSRREIDELTLPQIKLYSRQVQAKERQQAASQLYLAALAAGGSKEEINRKLKELS